MVTWGAGSGHARLCVPPPARDRKVATRGVGWVDCANAAAGHDGEVRKCRKGDRCTDREWGASAPTKVGSVHLRDGESTRAVTPDGAAKKSSGGALHALHPGNKRHRGIPHPQKRGRDPLWVVSGHREGPAPVGREWSQGGGRRLEAGSRVAARTSAWRRRPHADRVPIRAAASVCAAARFARYAPVAPTVRQPIARRPARGCPRLSTTLAAGARGRDLWGALWCPVTFCIHPVGRVVGRNDAARRRRSRRL